MTFDPNKPYNELPLLPPQIDLETKPILRKCITANRALAELKGAGDLIPNQGMLINAIPLHEAKLSSEIENIVTTTDKLFRAAVQDDGGADPQTKEVLRYRTALKYGFDTLAERPLSVNLFDEICSIIRGSQMSVRTLPGTKIINEATNEVVYTPPTGADVIREKLGNLEEYLHASDELDALIRLAVGHYQFEAIHPYYDGNGRTGRIINILFLVERGLLRIPVLYLSRHIIQHKNEYQALLRAVTESTTWENWILYALTAIEETARWTCGRIHAIRDLFDETCERCRRELPTRVYSKELIELIFVQPYCRIKFLFDAGIARRQAAAGYLQALEGLGVLTSFKVGREKIYVHPKLMEVLGA